MDTTSTVSHLVNSGSGALLLILGGIAISVALTVSYRKSQSNRSGANSTNINIGGDMK
jgi:uncharacterized membrane protein YidH (DUF202 family)